MHVIADVFAVLMDGFSENHGKQPVRVKIISMGNAEVGKVHSFSRS